MDAWPPEECVRIPENILCAPPAKVKQKTRRVDAKCSLPPLAERRLEYVRLLGRLEKADAGTRMEEAAMAVMARERRQRCQLID